LAETRGKLLVEKKRETFETKRKRIKVGKRQALTAALQIKRGNPGLEKRRMLREKGLPQLPLCSPLEGSSKESGFRGKAGTLIDAKKGEYSGIRLKTGLE